MKTVAEESSAGEKNLKTVAEASSVAREEPQNSFRQIEPRGASIFGRA